MDLGPFLDAVTVVRAEGASVREWSLYAAEARRLTLGTKDRETGNPHAPLALTESLAASYKLVWSDGKVSRGTLERRQLEQEAPETLAFARSAAYDDPDAAWVLGASEFPDVAMWDDATAAVAGGAAEPWISRLDSMRRRLLAHGLRTWSGSLHAGAGHSRLLTSRGLDVHGRGTSAGWSATYDGELGTAHAARILETEADFAGRLDRLVDLVERLRHPASAAPSGVLPVLLHPDVVEEYVLGTLLHNLDGSAVAHGEGAFRREQFGSSEPVLRGDLTLRLDPLLPFASGTHRFTSEGLPAARCDYVRNGSLVTPILDLKYSRRLGMPPTPLPFAMDTLFLEGPPPLRLDEALREAAGGALVLAVLGVHTQDFSSGDFSLSAPQALAIVGTGLGGRLRATLSGNLFALLRHPDLRLVAFEGEHTPGILVPCRIDPRD